MHRCDRGIQSALWGPLSFLRPLEDFPAGASGYREKGRGKVLKSARAASTGHWPTMPSLARLGHVTRVRMTQIMNLLHLAPNIQEVIFSLPRVEAGRDSTSERELRPLVALPNWRKQRRLWRKLTL